MAFPVFGVELELEAAWGMEGLCGLWCRLALELPWGAAFRAGLVGWERQRRWMVCVVCGADLLWSCLWSLGGAGKAT